MKLSAVVLTKNEEKNVGRCLSSLDFCNEIILIDDNSSDETLNVAKKKSTEIGKKVVLFSHSLNGNFAQQRNFGLTKAKGSWVLFIDADEVVSSSLKNEIKKVVNSQNHKFSSYYIKRRDIWWGRELKYGETKKTRTKGIVRLVKNNSGSWQGKVHETFKTKLKISRLNGFLNHYPHQTLKKFIESVNHYSTLRAEELYKNGEKSSLFQIIFFPFGKFLLTYFIYLGFLDKIPGFVYSFMMSFHSFLVRGKLYQHKNLN